MRDICRISRGAGHLMKMRDCPAECGTVDMYLYLYTRVCVCLCVYPSDGIHVVACGPIVTKFGTHMQIHLQMVVS